MGLSLRVTMIVTEMIQRENSIDSNLELEKVPLEMTFRYNHKYERQYPLDQVVSDQGIHGIYKTTLIIVLWRCKGTREQSPNIRTNKMLIWQMG